MSRFHLLLGIVWTCLFRKISGEWRKFLSYTLSNEYAEDEFSSLLVKRFLPVSLRVIPRCGRVDKLLWYYQMDRRQNHPNTWYRFGNFDCFSTWRASDAQCPSVHLMVPNKDLSRLCLKGNHQSVKLWTRSWFLNWKDILFNYLRQFR